MERAAYQVGRRRTVSYVMLAHVQPGKMLTVLVDPENQENVLIQWDSLAQDGGMGAGDGSPHGRVARLEALKTMHDKGLIEKWEYEQKKEEILREL